MPVYRLRKRPQYLRVAASKCRVVMPGLMLQVAKGEDPQKMGLGFTASRRVGGSVQRNRARRRLKALAQEFLEKNGVAGRDYVLVARKAIAHRSYQELQQDFVHAFRKGKQRFSSL